MTPPAKRLLPPCSSSLAASSIATVAPASRADSAAHSAALPLPTTITSYCFMPGGSRPESYRTSAPGGFQQRIPPPRQLDAAARRRPLEMVAHVGARLVAAGIARHQDLHHLRLYDDVHQPLRVARC